MQSAAWTCEQHAQANRAANNLNQQNNNMNHMHSQLDVCFCCSFCVVLLFRLAREQVALSFVIYPKRVCHAAKCKAHMKITYHTATQKRTSKTKQRVPLMCAFLCSRMVVVFSRFRVWWLFVVNLFPVAKKVARCILPIFVIAFSRHGHRSLLCSFSRSPAKCSFNLFTLSTALPPCFFYFRPLRLHIFLMHCEWMDAWMIPHVCNEQDMTFNDWTFCVFTKPP